MLRWPLLLVLCCAQSLMGQSVVVLSEDLTSAWFAPNALSTAQPVDRVVRLSGEDPSGPAPPSPTSPLTLLSATWQVKVAEYPQRDQHRQSLAGMYTLLSQQITEGTFKNMDQLEQITTEMLSMLLGGSRVRWDAWGQDVGGYLADNVHSLEVAAPAYLEVAAGLDNPAAINQQLLEFLLILLKLLLTNFGLTEALEVASEELAVHGIPIPGVTP